MPTNPQTHFSYLVSSSEKPSKPLSHPISFSYNKTPCRFLEILHMDDCNNNNCEQLLYFDNTTHKRRSFTTREERASYALPEFQINFHFSCTARISTWVLHEDSSETQLLGRFRCPTIRKRIRLNLEQFLSEKRARKIIRRKIKDWPVWAGGHRLLIDFALEKAWEKMESMPLSHNVVHLFLHAIPKHDHFFYEDEIRLAIQQYMEEAGAGMVPAVESAIESLEKTTSMESGSCSICLEEFVNGGESVSMPCSHVFHGDCIKKWLSVSHYCPMCRFEMPTS